MAQLFYRELPFQLITMKSSFIFFIFLFSSTCYFTIAGATVDDNDAQPSFLQWLFGTQIENSNKTNLTFNKSNSTFNATTLAKGRQLLINPGQALLIQQQQQQQQQLQAAALNQAVFNQQLQNGYLDDSSEEDDFDSDEFWYRSPIRHRSPIHRGVGLYRSGEVDSGEEINGNHTTTPATLTSSTNNRNVTSWSTLVKNGTSSESQQFTLSQNGTTLSQNGTTLSPNGTTLSPNGTTLSPNGTTLSTIQPQNETTTLSPTTTNKPNRKPPPYDASINCRCGTQTVQETKIRDAQVGINSYPWMVSIRTQSTHLCTGEIINSKYIITSASCLKGHDVQDMTIEGGLLSSNRTNFTPLKIFRHPQYKADTQENNLALIQVQEVIQPTSSIKFVCLPIGKKPKLDSGTLVTWTESSNQDLTLVEAQVQQVKEKRCRELLDKVNATNNLTPGTFCSAPPPQKQCGGDVGGSYLTHGKGYSFTLTGIISWTAGCKKRGIPAVMTNTHLYVRWILFKSQGGSFCKNPTFTSNEFNQLPE